MTSRRRPDAGLSAKARRDRAMQRPELRQPSAPRIFPAGATSAPIKAENPELRRMIDAAVASEKTPSPSAEKKAALQVESAPRRRPVR